VIVPADPPTSPAALDETIGRVVYEDLVRLTFLSGRGLTLPKLMERFLRTIRPRIPAAGLWLHASQGLVAGEAEVGVVPPAAPTLVWRGLVPEQLPGNRLIVSVLPEVVVDCLVGGPGLQRAGEVLILFARILALAWQAETVACPELFVDDYKTAKASFQRRWLEDLLARYHGNVSACARVAGLSRVTLYDLMREHGLRPRDEV
jgi:Bacterial regulatory protein, Fis family